MPIQTRLHPVQDAIRDAAATADVVAVPVRSGPQIDPDHADDLAGLLPFGAADLLAREEAGGEPGEIVSAPIRLGDGLAELILFGVGDGGPAALRKAGAALARRASGRAHVVAGAPSASGAQALSAFAEGLLLACYDFRVGGAPKRSAVEKITIRTSDAPAVQRGATIAGAVAVARDLANTPSRSKSPQWLAEQAERYATGSGLTIRIRDERELRAEGFGGLVAVGAGSARPPRLIELVYDPGDGGSPDERPGAPGERLAEHIVLVGKGVTFDSGGLSLKPNDGMKTMKTDMAGGAAVIGAMTALRALGVPVRVTGLVPAAENMPSGSAMRPGDVVRHYGGITSEVLNTDAEGRLVLADALAYADAELDPTVLVDIATLTGAAKVALGLRHGALYATADALAAELVEAGRDGGDPVWRMPLADEYRAAIDSDIADLANIGRGGFGAGSITAALFLRAFTGGRTWAHLDVAGPARATADEAERTRGATGFGVRLLLRWLSR